MKKYYKDYLLSLVEGNTITGTQMSYFYKKYMQCENDIDVEYVDSELEDTILENKSKLEEAIYSLDEDDLCNDNIIIDLEDLF